MSKIFQNCGRGMRERLLFGHMETFAKPHYISV